MSSHSQYFSFVPGAPFSKCHVHSSEKCAETLEQLHATGARASQQVRAEIRYVMVKPDGVQRGLVGEIIGRFERKGFKLKALQMRMCTREIAEEHYKDLKEKPFFKDLVDYILSGPVIAMVSIAAPFPLWTA